jgi:mRNA interferase MazF
LIENINPTRGEIWLINFDPTVGAEIRKIRPGLVISQPFAGHLPLRMVVPFTDWKPHYQEFEWFVKVLPSISNGLSKVSGADCFQCKSVSLERFVRKIGTFSMDRLEDIVQRINYCIA